MHCCCSFGLRWQAERDTALDDDPRDNQSAVAAALCRRTPNIFLWSSSHEAVKRARRLANTIVTVSNPKSHDSAETLIPAKPTLPLLRAAAADCQACDLWKHGTQTVFGEGPRRAKILFVGEQPGNEEDLKGKPFVGPAGRLFDGALAEAGIDRTRVYVTNVVKHFKWEPRGKRRIHKKPNTQEISACRPWLQAEIALIKPKVIVALGATAAQALLGPKFRVTKERGKFLESALAPYVMATVHPSSILRAPDDETRREERRKFIDDLKKLARVIGK
jgi:DNA polymerase